jgi:hypothetical protein
MRRHMGRPMWMKVWRRDPMSTLGIDIWKKSSRAVLDVYYSTPRAALAPDKTPHSNHCSGQVQETRARCKEVQR